MKKKGLAALLCLASSLVLFSACGGIKGFRDDADLESMEGVLREQKASDKELGTHFLIEDNEKIAVRSIALDLSSDKYLNNEVEVLGFMNEKDEVFEITSVTTVKKLSKEKKDSRFVSYKNEDLGIQLSYFSDWEMDDFANSVSFKKDSAKILLSKEEVFDNDKEAYLKLKFNVNAVSIDSLKRKVGPLKIEGYLITSPSEVTYVFFRDYFVYEFSMTDSYEFASSKKAFDQMMAEFKFIPINGEEEAVSSEAGELVSTDLADYTFFESLPYEFQAAYPKSWYYAGMRGGNDDVLHHYGFSDEAIEEGGEIISLDVLGSTTLPAGKSMQLSGKAAVSVVSGSDLSVYVQEGKRTYRISGPDDYEEVIFAIASSISPIPDEDMPL